MTAVPVLVADKLQGIDLSSYERRVLCVSTNMLPKHTADALGHNSVDGIHTKDWDEIGWIFWAQGKDDFGEYDQPTLVDHPELVALNDFAIERGYHYLLITGEEELLPPECGLPTFKW